MRQGLSNSEPQHKTAHGVLNVNQGCFYQIMFPYTIPVLYTVEFRKEAPGLIFFKGPFLEAYFWRGLSIEGHLRFKIDWASLILGRKFTGFFCFTLYLRAISKYKPLGLIF